MNGCVFWRVSNWAAFSVSLQLTLVGSALPITHTHTQWTLRLVSLDFPRKRSMTYTDLNPSTMHTLPVNDTFNPKMKRQSCETPKSPKRRINQTKGYVTFYKKSNIIIIIIVVVVSLKCYWRSEGTLKISKAALCSPSVRWSRVLSWVAPWLTSDLFVRPLAAPVILPRTNSKMPRVARSTFKQGPQLPPAR